MPCKLENVLHSYSDEESWTNYELSRFRAVQQLTIQNVFIKKYTSNHIFTNTLTIQTLAPTRAWCFRGMQ